MGRILLLSLFSSCIVDVHRLIYPLLTSFHSLEISKPEFHSQNASKHLFDICDNCVVDGTILLFL